MIFQLKKHVTKTGAGKEAYCTKKVREKKPIAPKQVREKDISGLLIKAKQCCKLASKGSQSRVGGEGSGSSLARELWWRQYKVKGQNFVL